MPFIHPGLLGPAPLGPRVREFTDAGYRVVRYDPWLRAVESPHGSALFPGARDLAVPARGRGHRADELSWGARWVGRSLSISCWSNRPGS